MVSAPTTRGPNVLILSSAGKPIFVRYGDETETSGPNEEEWSTACGVLQGLRANVLSFGLAGLERGASALGDVQSIRAGARLIVFKHTEALMLVSISDRKDGYHNEAWMRLQLEYVYAQLLFTLTDQVQSIFEKNPGYDLRNMMGPNEASSIRNLLDRFDPIGMEDIVNNNGIMNDRSQGTGCGSFLTAGVECINPIPPEIRERASKILLHSIGSNCNKDNLFAILMVGTRLVTIVQPSNPMSQLHTSDLHLVLTFVGRQPALLHELWFPLCLPRFDSSGFLHAYSNCLDQSTGLTIALISPDNSNEQFESFRDTSNTVRRVLGLRPIKSKVLRVHGATSSGASSASSVGGASASSGDSERKRTHLDVAAWKTKEEERASGGSYDDDEEENGQTTGPSISMGPRQFVNSRRLSETCYLDDVMEGHTFSDDEGKDEDEDVVDDAANEAPLITALKVALSARQQTELMEPYLEMASAVHFVFRCDIYVGNGETGGNIGASSTGSMLTQCFGPPLSFPFTDVASQRHVWDIYQRLSLRLRLGSSSVETTMDALDMICNNSTDARGVGQESPMQCLLESPPNVHSVTYLQEDNEWLFVGLNGKYFELYATLPATVLPKTATAYCARLVRQLMGDERILFLSNPQTWGSH